MTSRIHAAVLAAPGVLLGVAGLLHPMHLTAATAPRWTWLHVAGLFVFPLLGVALAVVVRGRPDPLAWLVRVAAYGYATAYTALDVVDGIGAGYVTWRLGAGTPRPQELNYLFDIGGRLGHVGAWCLVVAALLVSLDLLLRRQRPLAAAAAAMLVGGALLVRADHIFVPWGALGMVLVGVGTAVAFLLTTPEVDQQ